MILARLALYLILSGLFGLALFACTTPGVRGALPLRRWLGLGAVTALVASLVSLDLLAAQMGGGAAWPVDWDTVQVLLGETALGTAWMVRMVALVLALVLARTRALAATAAAAGVALATLAWTGHGAMDEGAAGWLHLAADIAHLLACGVWIGALIALLLLVAKRDADVAHCALAHGALRAFGTTGTIVVATLAITGLVNAWLLVGPSLSGLVTTLYGRLLLAKLALFAAMLGLAALNRFRLTPALEGEPRAAMRALRASLTVETCCAVTILAIVAWLGTLEPPISGG